jgi:ATP-dependent phosphofructokinase / diphosphate-dependent phosphofructokinase
MKKEAMKDAVAILCAGGPAPGINTVVSAVTKIFLQNGYTVLGINGGYKSLFASEPSYDYLDFEFADLIYSRGGSALKMSRHKPKDDEFKVDFFKKNNVKLLVTIGGDDSASSENRLTKFL